MSGYSVSGVVLGGLGVIGVFQALYKVLHYNLPAQQFRQVDEILTDTTTLFQTVVEEGLVTDAQWVLAVEQQLHVLVSLSSHNPNAS